MYQLSMTKPNSKKIPNSSPSRAKAKRKAVVRRFNEIKTFDGTLVGWSVYPDQLEAIKNEMAWNHMKAVQGGLSVKEAMAFAMFSVGLGITTGGART